MQNILNFSNLSNTFEKRAENGFGHPKYRDFGLQAEIRPKHREGGFRRKFKVQKTCLKQLVVLKNLLRNVILFYKISQMFRVVNETVIKQSCERLFQHIGAHLQ